MKKAIAAIAMLIGLLLGALGLASQGGLSAAPIDCPGKQTATKTASGWDCVNNGGNTSNAEDPKNPNAGKDKF